MKKDWEEFYKVEDPWHYNNSPVDLYRRKICLLHIKDAFNNKKEIKNLLDAGCGEGYLIKELSEDYDIQSDAFDISENAISYAKIRNQSEKINYFQLDILDLKKLKKEYDLIICEEVLFYLTKQEINQVTKNFYGLLKQEGLYKSTIQTKQGKYDPALAISIETYKNILENNGFKIISMLPYWIYKKKFLDKFLYRILYLTYRIFKLPQIINILQNRTLKYDVSQCSKVSVLAKAV